MSAIIEMAVDRKLQVIRQKMTGTLTETDARRMIEDMKKLATGLDDPHRIIICVDASALKKPDPPARRYLTSLLNEPDLKKIALYGAGPLERAFAKFVILGLGIRKFRVFATEERALRWLCRE